MSEMDEIVNEFVIESLEGLDQVDGELLRLEEHPDDTATLQSIFRTIHSMKGACGFLEFSVLQSVAHAGENLLDALRDGSLVVTDELTTTLLEMNDAIRSLLGTIQSTGSDAGGDDFGAIIEQLEQPLVAVASQGGSEPGELASPSGGSQAAEPGQSPAVQRPSHHGFPAENSTGSESSTAPIRASTSSHASAALAARSASESSVRLRVEQLDALMNLAGELVLTRNQVIQQSVGIDDATTHATTQRLSRITTELHEGIMKIRMQPVNTLTSRLPRVVRGMAKQLKKEVQLVIEGADTEVDKTLLEAIKDPLTHLVRNSLDHGIEPPDAREAAGKPRTATLTLSAFHESGEVNVIVKDDGRGIDPEVVRTKAVERGLCTSKEADRMDDRTALELLFAPGFSTAQSVTNISGRGVGMDVVRRNLECVGGTVDVDSEVGQGTEVTIRIPLTLAIIPALTVQSGGSRYAIRRRT